MGDRNRDLHPDSPPGTDRAHGGSVDAPADAPNAAEVVPADTEHPTEPDDAAENADRIGGVTQAEHEGA